MRTTHTHKQRPAPRRRGLSAALETAEVEDGIVNQLCPPDGVVTAGQAATALALAKGCAQTWLKTVDGLLEAGSKVKLYHLSRQDREWLDLEWSRRAAEPDHNMVARLQEQILDRAPFDVAMTASFNAARWLVKQCRIYLN
jgi:hypothetical protein